METSRGSALAEIFDFQGPNYGLVYWTLAMAGHDMEHISKDSSFVVM